MEYGVGKIVDWWYCEGDGDDTSDDDDNDDDGDVGWLPSVLCDMISDAYCGNCEYKSSGVKIDTKGENDVVVGKMNGLLPS